LSIQLAAIAKVATVVIAWQAFQIWNNSLGFSSTTTGTRGSGTRIGTHILLSSR